MSHRPARQLRIILAEAFGTLFEAAGFCGLIAALGFADNIILKAGGMAAGAVVLALGHILRTTGKRLRQPDAAELLAADPRPPILYLRSFSSDGQNAGADPTQMLAGHGLLGGLISGLGQSLSKSTGTQLLAYETDEEFLTLALRPWGPTVTIGKPGEQLPPIGAARFYVQPDQWQSQVRDLSHSARAVVFRAGSSPGLLWEIQHCLAHLDPTRIVFWLSWPMDTAPAQYAALTHTLAPLVNGPLPAWRPGAVLLAFAPGGRPILSGSKLRFWERGGNSQWSTARISAALVDAQRQGALPPAVVPPDLPPHPSGSAAVSPAQASTSKTGEHPPASLT